MEQTLKKLEARVEDLLKATSEMRRQNDALRTQQELLQQQFTALREKNKIAHGRIEQIVARLKELEAVAEEESNSPDQ